MRSNKLIKVCYIDLFEILLLKVLEIIIKVMINLEVFW